MSQKQWNTPIIPSTWKAEVGGFQVQDQEGELRERPCLIIKIEKG